MVSLSIEQPTQPDTNQQSPAVDSGESTSVDQPGTVQPNGGIPKKRIKLNPLLITLFVSFYILLFGYGGPIDNILTQRCNNSFGMLFESIGIFDHAIGEWRIIIYYELSPYWIHFLY